MFYVGLDIRSKSITICVLNGLGKIARRCTVRQTGTRMAVLKRLPGRQQVCYEASTGYGVFFEMLSKVADDVAVAHPGLLRLIFRSKQKNDRRGPEKLAKLLYLDAVPTVHVPTAEVRAWRELITFRRRLIEKRTRAKNGVRSLVPCQDQSGGSNRLGHINREGSATVPHLLTEAVWQAVRRSPTVAAYLARVSRGEKDRRKIAIVATAHYLVRVM